MVAKGLWYDAREEAYRQEARDTVIKNVPLHREIRAGGWRARMVLQVHDELIFSLPESEVDAFTQVVRQCMEGAMTLDVPLRVDVKTGRTWAEC